MTTLMSNLHQKSIASTCQKHDIDYLGVFGSTARGEDTPHSDVDLLISFNQPKTLFDLARIKIFFQDLLGVRKLT